MHGARCARPGAKRRDRGRGCLQAEQDQRLALGFRPALLSLMGRAAGRQGPARPACPCPQGQLARPPPLLKACSLIQSLRGSPPSRRALLGGPCAGHCLFFWTPVPLLPCAASWEADPWEPGAPEPTGFPLGSARGGGCRRCGRCWEWLGSRQVDCAVPAPVLQPLFFFFNLFI